MGSCKAFIFFLLFIFENYCHGIQGNGIAFPNAKLPLIIANRGGTAEMPRHTIPAYEFSMAAGVDYVETTLVLTKDSVFVCSNLLTLASTTNVRDVKEVEHLRIIERNITVDGVVTTIRDDWLISDFTLAELKLLRAVQQPVGIRPLYFDNLFSISTLDEFILTVHKFSLKAITLPGRHKIVGMVLELKHASYHNALLGTPFQMEDMFIRQLESHGYSVSASNASHCEYNSTKIPCSSVIVESFEPETINYLHSKTALRLMGTLETTPLNLRYLMYKGLAELKGKMEFVSVWKELLYTGTLADVAYEKLDYDKEEIQRLGGFIEPQKFVDYAEELGMKVGVYVIYSSWEDSLRGCAVRCTNESKTAEMEYYFRQGVKAVFVEGLCESLRIRDAFFGSYNYDLPNLV